MDFASLAFDVQNWIKAVFNKEALAVFVVFCAAIFAMATMAVVWAIDNGEFKNLEAAKFEMMEN